MKDVKYFNKKSRYFEACLLNRMYNYVTVCTAIKASEQRSRKKGTAYMKKILAIALALAMLLTACVALAESDEETITLRIVWWGSQQRHNDTLAVIDRYMELNPNIVIESEYMAWANYWDKLASQAAGGQMPDIFQNDYNYIAAYAGSNLSIPMDEFLGKEIDTTYIDSVYLDGGRVNGELHGISLGTGGPTIIYDPDVFEELGLDEPDATWTYEDYEAAMRTIKEEKGILGATMLYDGSPYRGFEAYARQCGEGFYTEEGELNFSRQTLIDYFTMYSAWQQEGLVGTPDVISEACINVESDQIITGKSAMVWRNSNQISAMSSAAGKNFKMTYLPNKEDQVKYGGYIKHNMYFSISKDSKNASEAAKFISYFVNDIEANSILRAERGVPISSAVRDSLYESLSEVEKTMFDFMGDYVNYSSPLEPPQPASYAEVSTLLTRCEEQIVYGEKSIEDAVDEFLELANKAIENVAQ